MVWCTETLGGFKLVCEVCKDFQEFRFPIW